MAIPLDGLIQMGLHDQARSSSQTPPPVTNRKRKAGLGCYENDALRIQGKLDNLPTVLVQDVHKMRPGEVLRALVRLECAEAKDVIEFDDLKVLLSKELGRLEACSVCQATPTNGEAAIFLPCKHVFHRDCIHSWAQNDYKQGRHGEGDVWYRPRCPNCRKPAL